MSVVVWHSETLGMRGRAYCRGETVPLGSLALDFPRVPTVHVPWPLLIWRLWLRPWPGRIWWRVKKIIMIGYSGGFRID
jgi:hypothetical protein